MGYDQYLYNEVMQQLHSCSNVTEATLYVVQSYTLLAYQSNWQNRFSKPLPWIGIYISVASLVCILAMVADFLHGLRNRKLWFPCKYFTLNAASLTVIAVAMKLPMDLNNLMPGNVDHAAKVGGMAYMCTMMANQLPSLATMDNKELVTNVIALGVLVMTLVVNVCIQMKTGVLLYHANNMKAFRDIAFDQTFPSFSIKLNKGFIEAIYVALLLMLLIIYASSSLAILKSKQILESKYQAAHETCLKEQGVGLTLEKLKRLVSNYWIMAGTGSPQFMTTCFVTTSACGVICGVSTFIHILIMLYNVGSLWDYDSDYKWSMLVILIVQFIGVIVGTIAPLSRCFAALSFKLSVKWIWNHIKVYKVESYWTHKLYDWKNSSIPFPSSSRKCKIIIQNMKVLILYICIGFQMTVVVACKMIAVIPIFFVICTLYCFRCWKWLKAIFRHWKWLKAIFGDELEQKTEQLGKDKDLSHYVLQLQDNMEFAERTLKRISKSVDSLIQKAEKHQPKNLMKILVESTGFEGVEKFDSHHVPPLLSEENLNTWSLPLVTLTAIAISLPNIKNKVVDCLLNSVSEGLVYVTLVEQILNATDDHVSIQKATKTLWLEIEVYHKWLGNKLSRPTHQVNTTAQILQWLSDTAKNMVIKLESMDIGARNDNSKFRSISANSMYRITKTILLSYHTNIDQVSQEELFAQLSSMIADILAACLTNLPQVISMKCHASAIEKREASVQIAAKLLGETTQIINSLKDRELPNLNLDELSYIEKWRAYLQHPFP